MHAGIFCTIIRLSKAQYSWGTLVISYSLIACIIVSTRTARDRLLLKSFSQHSEETFRLSQIASGAFSGTVQGTVKAQLKDASNDMFKTLFPILNKIGAICLSICHNSFSRKKLFSNEAY